MCLDGKIKGAAKLGRMCAIPIDADKPVDGRVTTGIQGLEKRLKK